MMMKNQRLVCMVLIGMVLIRQTNTVEGYRWIGEEAMKRDVMPGRPNSGYGHENANRYDRGCLKEERCRGIPWRFFVEEKLHPTRIEWCSLITLLVNLYSQWLFVRNLIGHDHRCVLLQRKSLFEWNHLICLANLRRWPMVIMFQRDQTLTNWGCNPPM